MSLSEDLLSQSSLKKVSEVCNLYLGGTPKTSISDFWNGDIKWATAKDVSNCQGRYIGETERKITLKATLESNAKIYPKGTIVITARGTVGKIAILSMPMAFNQTCYGLVVKPQSDSMYVFYSLKNSLADIGTLSYGTVFQTITTKTFDEILIKVPPLKDQKAIAKILSDLDSKIELNQKMNSTLESIAQAIFKHWFIDFEFPNEEGKPYRLSGGDMVDSELGEIPKGWEVIKTGDVINVIRGVSYRSDQLKYSKEALVTLKSVIRGGGFTKNGFKSYLGAYKNNQVLHSNDVIVAFTDLTQLAEVIGRPALIKETSEYKTIVASMDIGIIRPQEYFPYKFFIYHLMRSEAFHSHVLGYVNGTTVLHLSNEGPKSFKFPCPYINSIVTFENFASQLYERVQNNSNQIEYLTSLRDLILPKLISGKIRVPMEE